MIAIIRFAGIANASIWFGAAVFTIFGLPAIFQGESGRILTPQYAGFAAQALLERYYLLQYYCSAVALAHLALEWLYVGRAARRFTLGLLAAMALLSLAGGLLAQPKIAALHREKYWGQTPAAQAFAARRLMVWHGAAQGANLLVVGGLVVYLWRVVRSTENSRFAGSNKIRS